MFPRADLKASIEKMKDLEIDRVRSPAELCWASLHKPPQRRSADGVSHITIDDFAKVDLRVGIVKEAVAVKGADKLLHLKVDIGEPQPRSIVAGIALAYKPDALIGRKVVIVANLAPRKLRGLDSQGMIVAASLEGGVPVLAGFLEDVPIGARLKVTFVDSHCHLDHEQFNEDREAVIDRALAAGRRAHGRDRNRQWPSDLEAGIALADKYPAFYATVGVHPHDASKANDEVYRRLSDLLAHPKVVALGEIGLDYHYDFSPRDVQHTVFVEQMKIARDARKPIVIHTREAWDDTLSLLREHWAPAGLGGIMHCFSGGPAQASQALGLGFYLSFGGIVTFPKALDIQEAARQTPPDRLLIETDAPVSGARAEARQAQ